MNAKFFHFNTLKLFLSKYKFAVLSVIFSLWIGNIYPTPIIEKGILTKTSTCKVELPYEQEMQFDIPFTESKSTIPGQKIIVVTSVPTLFNSGFRSISFSTLQIMVYSKGFISLFSHYNTLKSKIFHISPLINQLQI